MRKIKNHWVHKEGYDCFGCSPDNPLGVKMEFYEDGDDIVCFWKPQAHYQGWIDTLHGGIQATLIDECASWVVFRKLQTSGVTNRLEVKYRKSIMTTEPQITIRARLTEMKRQVAFIHVEIYTNDCILRFHSDCLIILVHLLNCIEVNTELLTSSF